jgi:hypothetical protein
MRKCSYHESQVITYSSGGTYDFASSRTDAGFTALRSKELRIWVKIISINIYGIHRPSEF